MSTAAWVGFMAFLKYKKCSLCGLGWMVESFSEKTMRLLLLLKSSTGTTNLLSSWLCSSFFFFLVLFYRFLSPFYFYS